MGFLIISSLPGARMVMDDRTLAHLQLVIGGKLRLDQSLFLTWVDPVETGTGRSSFWIGRTTDLQFRYDTNTRHALNRQWTELLMTSANSPGGLQLVPEPTPEPQPAPAARSRRSIQAPRFPRAFPAPQRSTPARTN